MRFLIQQKYFSIRDGFYITDEAGRNAYFVQGKFFSLGKQLTMYDSANREVLFIKQKLFRLLANFNVFQGEQLIANIKRKLPLILFKRYKVKSDVLGDLTIKGNIVAWNFSILDSANREVGRVSKKVLKIRDTYTIDIFDKNLESIILALTIVLDAAHHRKH